MAQTDANPESEGYHNALAEIMRGIQLVSGLKAQAAATGWVAVECKEPGKARWLAEQINQENVQSYAAGSQFFVPVGEYFSLKGEIKNVITAVAKTTHYWQDHISETLRSSLAWEAKFKALQTGVRKFLGLGKSSR